MIKHMALERTNTLAVHVTRANSKVGDDITIANLIKVQIRNSSLYDRYGCRW